MRRLLFIGTMLAASLGAPSALASSVSSVAPNVRAQPRWATALPRGGGDTHLGCTAGCDLNAKTNMAFAARRNPVTLPVPVYSGSMKLGRSTSAVEYSMNWAGYTTTARKQYRGVGASMTVPYINTLTIQGDAGNMAAHWVGLDGYRNHAVEQDGIGEYYDPNFGTGYSFTWWELYPANAMQGLFYVTPGDQVFAGVTWHEGSYWRDHHAAFEMYVDDNTTGDWYSYGWRPNYYIPRRSSAEVITEVPSSPSGAFALTNYGNEAYQYAYTTTMPYDHHSLGHDRSQDSHRVILANGIGQTLAWTTGLTQRGSSFATPYRQGL